jgi:acetyltransferase EpsM
METKVTLYGASGHCKVIIDILQKNTTEIATIIDDNPAIDALLGEVVVSSKQIDFDTLDNVIVAIGNNKVRKQIAAKLKVNFAQAIHPMAIVSNFATIGEGTVVMAGVILNPDVSIGKHCIINSGAIIEHDCTIDDFVHISPSVSLAGDIQVGEGTHIGIGASVIQGIKIGKWVTIGAGTVLIKDVPDYAVVVGNPGKIIKYNNKNE